MRLFVIGAVAVIPLLLPGCAARKGDPGVHSRAEVQSVYTDLSAASCRSEVDKSDPNETPYLVCPGVAGYSLIVRRVEAGRQSIDIVDPARRMLPLDYQDVVTRHMFNLDGKVEWRVATRSGRQVPIALMVRVQAREDNDDPGKVTRTLWAVAKIEPDKACVTGTIAEGARSVSEMRDAADTAQEKQCAPRLPPLMENGNVIR